jgi:predicted nucleic acid-binding protein
VTWDEVSWAVRRFLGNEIALLEGRSFLNLPRLKLLTVDSEVILKARELAERDGLKPRDAIHADAAMRNGIRELMSYDAGFDAIPGLTRLEPRNRPAVWLWKALNPESGLRVQTRCSSPLYTLQASDSLDDK